MFLLRVKHLFVIYAMNADLCKIFLYSFFIFLLYFYQDYKYIKGPILSYNILGILRDNKLGFKAQ